MKKNIILNKYINRALKFDVTKCRKKHQNVIIGTYRNDKYTYISRVHNTVVSLIKNVVLIILKSNFIKT